jgi:hypothetical protein
VKSELPPALDLADFPRLHEDRWVRKDPGVQRVVAITFYLVRILRNFFKSLFRAAMAFLFFLTLGFS